MNPPPATSIPRGTMTRFRIFSFAALLTGVTTIPTAGQVDLDVKVGVSMSDLEVSGVGINSQEGRRGVVAGASLTLPVSGPFALRFDGSYLQKGATFSLIQIGDVSLSLDYLQLAALVQASVPLGGARGSLYFLAGPAIARETSCRVRIVSALQPITQMGNCTGEELRTPTKAVDYAVSGGAGVRLAVTRRVGLSLEFLYTRGLRSIYAGELGWTGHNRAMTVEAGVTLPVG